MLWTLLGVICLLCLAILLAIALKFFVIEDTLKYQKNRQKSENLKHNYDHYYDYGFFYGYLSEEFYDTVSHFSSSYETVSEFSLPESYGTQPKMAFPEDLMEKFLHSCLEMHTILQRIQHIEMYGCLPPNENTVKSSQDTENNDKILVVEDKTEPMGDENFEHESAFVENEDTWVEIDLQSGENEATEPITEPRPIANAEPVKSKKRSFRKRLKKFFCCLCCCCCGKKD